MKFHKTQLEDFIESYIRQHQRNRTGIKFVRKALSLINHKIEDPCCLDPNFPTDLFTPFNNNLTSFVSKYLEITPRKGNLTSWRRARTLLSNYLTCCGRVTIT